MHTLPNKVTVKSFPLDLITFLEECCNMANNRHIAMQRLQSLKRKFKRNESFHNEYTAFLKDVITRGYAEPVQKLEMEGAPGRTWYIPHQGVYHPKKNTLGVVYDCGVPGHIPQFRTVARP
jgi:hypothetical protein